MDVSRESAVELAVLRLTDGKRSVDDIGSEIIGSGLAQSVEEARTLVLAVLEGKTVRSPRTARTSEV